MVIVTIFMILNSECREYIRFDMFFCLTRRTVKRGDLQIDYYIGSPIKFFEKLHLIFEFCIALSPGGDSLLEFFTKFSTVRLQRIPINQTILTTNHDTLRLYYC